MANQKHLDILEQGVEVWNQWRREHAGIQPDLSEADFSYANFRYASLGSAILRGANFSYADLFQALLNDAKFFHASLDYAKLSFAKLEDAKFGDSSLFGAYLEGADLRRAKLWDSHLKGAHLRGADLREADLDGALLIRTDLREADLRGCSIHGVSVWNINLEGALQSQLIISDKNEPRITVDDLEIAQFIYLLLNYKKLRNVFNAVTERGVLILGRFGGGGLEVLHAIAAKLREESYLPIIFDFERPQDRNYTETIQTLTGLARFVIADLSGPSVPQELYATIPHFKIPFVPIIEANRKSFAMSLDLLEFPWVVRPPVTFATTEELLEQLSVKVIAPAEEKRQARQKFWNELFNQD
jgi:hypothetical protein